MLIKRGLKKRKLLCIMKRRCQCRQWQCSNDLHRVRTCPSRPNAWPIIVL